MRSFVEAKKFTYILCCTFPRINFSPHSNLHFYPAGLIPFALLANVFQKDFTGQLYREISAKNPGFEFMSRLAGINLRRNRINHKISAAAP